MNKIVSVPIAEATPISPDHNYSHPDAELFALVEQFAVAERRYRELRSTVDRMEEEQPRGFKKLVKETDRADKVAARLDEQICETRATTVDGLLAKIRAAHAYLFCEPSEIYDIEIDQISGCADRVAESIFRDLQHLCVGRGEHDTGDALSAQQLLPGPLVDPIFAAIEAHRAGQARHIAAIDSEAAIELKWRAGECDDALYQEAGAATVEAIRAVDAVAMTFLDIKPTSVAGAAALLDYVAAAPRQTFPDPERDDKERTLFETKVMRHVAKALGARRDKQLDVTDPIFAAIEDHRRAETAWRGACRGPESKAQERKADRLCTLEEKAMVRLEVTIPTTLQGLATLLGYLKDYIERERGDLNLVFSDSTPIFTTLARAAADLYERE